MSEPIGSIKSLTRKSSRSRIVEPAPRGLTPYKILKPNAHGSESIIIIIILM